MQDLRGWVASDVVGAGRGEGRACREVFPDVAGPVAAERGVEDDLVGYEVTWDVAGSLSKSF